MDRGTCAVRPAIDGGASSSSRHCDIADHGAAESSGAAAWRREISRIGILSRNAQRRITLKNPMSITPYLPDQIRQCNVFTWVNSQWKFGALPGHFSAEINSTATIVMASGSKEQHHTASGKRAISSSVTFSAMASRSHSNPSRSNGPMSAVKFAFCILVARFSSNPVFVTAWPPCSI